METKQNNIYGLRIGKARHRTGLMAVAISVLCITQLQAQTVVATSGGDASTANNKISWTVGQPVTTTVSGGGATLTQGFQQPWADISTVIGENAGSEADIRVYPNPVHHLLNVEVPGATAKDQLELMDAAGRIVLQANTTGDRTELDLTQYGAGNYFLRIRNAEGILARTFKINITH